MDHDPHDICTQVENDREALLSSRHISICLAPTLPIPMQLSREVSVPVDDLEVEITHIFFADLFSTRVRVYQVPYFACDSKVFDHGSQVK